MNQSDVSLTCAAIVCEHIANSKDPVICYAQRDQSEEPADSGWQFLCGREDEDWDKAQVWSIGEVLEISPEIKEFVNSPVGTVLARQGAGDPWNVIDEQSS